MIDSELAASSDMRAAYLAAQKRRNAWLALALIVFVVLVGVISVIRISGSDMSKSDGLYFTGAIPEIEKESSPETSPPAPQKEER